MHIRSGPMCLWMRPEMVGPKVFSCSEPIQIKYLKEGTCYVSTGSASIGPWQGMVKTARVGAKGYDLAQL